MKRRECGDSARPLATALCVIVAAMSCWGCDGSSDDEQLITGIDNLPGGNPVVPQVALLPFPSDFYLVDDPDTVTGRRVNLAPEGMPEDLSAETFAQHDGFSRVGAMLTLIDGGIDPASLPAPDDPGASVADDSPVWVVREGAWDRVPLLVEVDATADSVADQALIIRPMQGLQPDTGYVVILRDSLVSADGASTPQPTAAFRALRDGIATDCDEVEAQREDYVLVNDAIAGLGLDPLTVVQAWPFHTQSEEQLTAPLLGMQDIAASWPLGDWTIDSDEIDGDDRLIRGTFEVPDFLGDDQWVTLDQDGAPVMYGTREAPFMITIPDSIGEQTRPVIVFGHGFFSAIEEPTWSSLNHGIHEWRMAAVTTEFIGFNEDDLGAALLLLAGDLDHLWVLTSQQMQSHANFTVLARLIHDELAETVLSDGGVPLLDGDQVHYMGISNGGTQGLVMMTASPLFTRGALVVGGGGWTHMIQRAIQWDEMGQVLQLKYDDEVEMLLLLSLLQMTLDPVDALNWVAHLTDDRFPGRPTVELSLTEAVGDCQVPNFLTEAVARTAGIPLITPSPRDVWGLDTVTAAPPAGADVDAALLVIDVGAVPPPAANVPPDEDNHAHEDIRNQASYIEHIGTFLETGVLIQPCDGACDPD